MGFIRCWRNASGLVVARPRPVEVRAPIIGRRMAEHPMMIAQEFKMARLKTERVFDSTLHRVFSESALGHSRRGLGLPIVIGSREGLRDGIETGLGSRQIRERSVVVPAEIGRKFDVEQMRRRLDCGDLFSVVIGVQWAGVALPRGLTMLRADCTITRRKLRGRRLH